MTPQSIEIRTNEVPHKEELEQLYKSVGWGHASCPNALMRAVESSSTVITVRAQNELIGLGRAISDNTITVYFPDLLIKPEWQGQGIGSRIMQELLKIYCDYHNQVLIAEDDKARDFYLKHGFKPEKYALSIYKPFPRE